MKHDNDDDDKAWMVYRALQGLLRHSADIEDVVNSYDAMDFREWRERLIGAAVDLARPAAEAYAQTNPRAASCGPEVACPLCGYASSKPYSDGYKWPEGLRFHLGGHGSTQPCDVIEALGWAVRQLTNGAIEQSRTGGGP